MRGVCVCVCVFVAIKAKGCDFFFFINHLFHFFFSVKFFLLILFHFRPNARVGLCLTNPFSPTQVEQLFVWVARTVSEGNSQNKMLFTRNDPVEDRGLSDDGSMQGQLVCHVGKKPQKFDIFGDIYNNKGRRLKHQHKQLHL